MLACRRLCRGVDAEVYAGVDADGCLCAGRSACVWVGVLARGQERMRVGRSSCAWVGAHARHCFKVTFLLIISNNLESLFIDDTIPIKFYRVSSV